MAENKHKARLDVAVASNDRTRSRGVTLTTLCAASAGVLATALVIVPVGTHDLLTQKIGFLAVSLLVFATSFFAAAIGSGSYDDSESKFKNLANKLSAWKIDIRKASDSDRLPSDENEENYLYLLRIEQAKILKKGINRNIDIGYWLAAGAVLCFVAALFSTTFISNKEVSVFIRADRSLSTNNCPMIGNQFVGTVNTRDLGAKDSLLAVKVSAKVCGSDTDSIIYMDKNNSIIFESDAE